VRALTSAKPGVAGGGPRLEEESAAEVVRHGWFAAVVTWACEARGSASIAEAVVHALRLVRTSLSGPR